MTTETTEREYATLTGTTLQLLTRNGDPYTKGDFEISRVIDAWAYMTLANPGRQYFLRVMVRTLRGFDTREFPMQTELSADLAERQVRALLKARREAVTDGSE